jgi:hypothetical protein
VTATNATLSQPFESAGNPFGFDSVAAIITYDDEWDSVSNVVATMYPIAYYDYDSYVPTASNINATSGFYGIYAYDDDGGVFGDLGMYMDVIGVLFDDTDGNVITQSSFVDCSSWGVATINGEYNYIYDNNFIGNNGAGSTYSAAHIQAYSGYGTDDYFYFEDVGNYWSDWHTTYQYGDLMPYPLGDLSWDYYPLAGPVGSFGVWFEAEGLNAGASWSVTFNGHTQATTNDYLVFYALPGTYSFTVASASGYSETPGSGSVTVTNSEQDQYLYFTAQYNVSVTETGLPTGTSWSAAVGGVTATGTTSTLNIPSGSGTMSFQIAPVAGYTASPASGTVTVTNGVYDLWVTFTQVTYTVTLTESGLSGQAWSVSVNGATQSSTGSAITLALPNGTYAVTVMPVSGYSASASKINVTVAGSPAGGSVTFSPSSTTSYVSTDSFNTWLAVAIAVAVIALVLGLLALFMRRGKGPQSSPQQWNAPPSGSTEGSAAASGGSGSWSEGPPAGGSPPS